eukprot:m.204065 g.204065  ORF g.204065 m.204065 type:complete len:319 (+) comp18870_c2_seq4:387-1343(+)
MAASVNDIIDGYNSEEDDDYVPEGANEVDSDGEVIPRTKRTGAGTDKKYSKRRRTAASATVRRGAGGRVGGICLEDSDDDNGNHNDRDPAGDRADTNVSAQSSQAEADSEAAKQKALDDLFAAEFGGAQKKKVAPKKKIAPKKKGAKVEFRMPGCAATRKVSTTASNTAERKTVTVSKTFDFAGEQVTVNKVVDEDSKEAKSFAAAQTKANTTTSALGNLLQSIKKKSTMSTVVCPFIRSNGAIHDSLWWGLRCLLSSDRNNWHLQLMVSCIIKSASHGQDGVVTYWDIHVKKSFCFSDFFCRHVLLNIGARGRQKRS